MKDTWKVVVGVLVIAFCFNVYRSMNSTRRADPRPVNTVPTSVASPTLPSVAPQPPPILPVTSIPKWFTSQGTWKEIERPSDGWYLKKQLTESSQALGFTIGEEMAFNAVTLPSAEEMTALRGDYFKIRTRYQPAINELKQRMLEGGLTQAQFDQLIAKLETGVRDQISKAAPGELAGKVPGTLAVRARDGYEGGVHRILMGYHPEVCERPILELEWGIEQRVPVEQYLKFKSHKPVITIPRSWKMEPGKGAHIAVTCSDPRSQMFAMIGVTDIPEAASSSAAEVLPEMLQGVREEKGGVNVVRTGYTKVYGYEALWYFGTNVRVSAESTVFQRIIAVMPFVKGSVYTIMFRADSVLSEANAEERMSRFQPLAMRMLSVMTLD